MHSYIPLIKRKDRNELKAIEFIQKEEIQNVVFVYHNYQNNITKKTLKSSVVVCVLQHVYFKPTVFLIFCIQMCACRLIG